MLTDEEKKIIANKFFDDYSDEEVFGFAEAIERAVLAKAMPIPKQEPFGYFVDIEYHGFTKKKPDDEFANCTTALFSEPQPAQAAANPLVDAVFSASHKKAADTHGKCPHCPHECAQEAAITEWMPIETMPFNTPVLVSDEKIIASMFFYKRKDRGYENSLYPQFMGAGDAEVRVSLYPNGCYSKLKWWRPMLEIPLSASPKPE